MKPSENNKQISRRNFIKTGLASSGIFINTGTYSKAEREKTSVKDIEMRYRILGRTGIKVSEIGMGTWGAPNENVVHYALERGFNYFDTAPNYKQGVEERLIGKVVKGRRDKVVIASKMQTTYKSTKEDTMRFIEGSLKRLKSDYIDVMMIYSIGQKSPRYGKKIGIERLNNENVIEAAIQAKKEGKIRAFGASSHGKDLISNMNYAIDSGNYDMIMVKYNFMALPEEEKLIKNAKQNNVGFVAMKIPGYVAGVYSKGGNAFKLSKTPEFRRAAIKRALSNPDITNCIMRMSTFEEVDNCLKALDEKMGYKDITSINKPLANLALYNYIHESKKDIIPKVDAIIKEMIASGEMAKLIKKAENQIIEMYKD